MRHSHKIVAKYLAWFFWALNLGIICTVWAVNHVGVSGLSEWLLAIGRLLGLLTTYCVLVQVVVIGRAGWLEPVFGFDRLALFHRRNGLVAFVGILLHPVLVVTGYAVAAKVSFFEQYWQIILGPIMLLAVLAAALFIAAVVTSIYLVRKHLKFELWQIIHYVNYAAVLLIVWHQITYGADLLGSKIFTAYWIGLYIFALTTIVVWRWVLPIVRSKRFGFKVAKVEAATPSATSVYIEGKGLAAFGARGGQFITVRFLTPKLRKEEHPFSLSMLPSDTQMRITARQLGDFTKGLAALKPGTRVVVGGPYGVFTHYAQRTNKILYIAGGIGITPIRTLLEERAQQKAYDNAVLLYGNRSLVETALWEEVQSLAQKTGVTVYNVLSEQPNWSGEKGYIDAEKIKRLVPDVVERDIFVCGPPAMVNAVLPVIQYLGVPQAQVHYERFSLHKQ